MPAIFEIFDAYGPDALTSISQFILSSDFRITDWTLFLDLESVKETASFFMYSTLFFIAELFHQLKMVLPS